MGLAEVARQLEDAKESYNEGYYDVAIVGIYQASIQALGACAILMGINVGTERELIGLFSERIIKTKAFIHSDLFINLLTKTHDALSNKDYNVLLSTPAEEVELGFATAGQLRDILEEFIEETS